MSLIVSVTSISSRLPVLRHTLISLLDQHCKPDRIVLLLSKEPYLMDDGVNDPPPWLDAMVARRDIELQWVENTGPYRKLMPIYRTATDEDAIVTCDDDVIYGPDWLSALVSAAKANAESIICGRARRVVKNIVNRRQSYINWPLVNGSLEATDILPIGIAGVLYRKPLLCRRMMLSNDFLEIAPTQDDLWFDAARKRAGKNVFVAQDAGSRIYPIKVPRALSGINVSKNIIMMRDGVAARSIRRVGLKTMGYLGVATCDNDSALGRLNDYLHRLDQAI